MVFREWYSANAAQGKLSIAGIYYHLIELYCIRDLRRGIWLAPEYLHRVSALALIPCVSNAKRHFAAQISVALAWPRPDGWLPHFCIPNLRPKV